jgi:hypothetical protein
MTIEMQQKGNHVFFHYTKDELVVSIALTMIEARNMRDFLTDLLFYGTDPTVIEVVMKDMSTEDVGVAELPKNFELIALADSQRRNEKDDDKIRKFLEKKNE